ncbi:MAG: phosphate ABC transporter permease subunit PstC, partial [Rhodospirillaceae bacterium]|nr:phosphate ABC transporter permease subunit PstC [Rhodospirillaceae bacterium]
MHNLIFTALILIFLLAIYHYGRRFSLLTVNHNRQDLHSLPGYYGLYLVFWFIGPAVAALIIWLLLEPPIIMGLLSESLTLSFQAAPDDVMREVRLLASNAFALKSATPEKVLLVNRYQELQALGNGIRAVLVLGGGVLGVVYARRFLSPEMRARQSVERFIKVLLILCSVIAIFTTIGIVLSLLFEAIRFFHKVSPAEFLFGLHWSPQTALRADQVGASGAFGAVPVFAGTFLITIIAMCVSIPIGLMSAIYLAEYATPRIRNWVKPSLEILAGVPTVVYGFFAALTVAPFIRGLGEQVGIAVASESALAAGLVMGIMIIPFISSLSDDIINAVPQSLRDGAYAMGSTKSETIRQVVLPAALPGIVGSILLAVSRAIGETM